MFYYHYYFIYLFSWKCFFFSCSGMFRNVPECSGMFRNVPCSGFYRRPLLSDRRSLHSIGLTQILSNALFPVTFRPFPFLGVFGHVDSSSLTGRQKLSVVCPLVRQFCYVSLSVVPSTSLWLPKCSKIRKYLIYPFNISMLEKKNSY